MRQTEISSNAYRKARQLLRGDKVGKFCRLLGREKGRVLLSGISGSEVGRSASATRTSQRSYCDTDAVKPKARTDVLLLPITWNLPTSPKTRIHANDRKGGLAGLFISTILFRVRCTRGLSGRGKPLVRCADAARLTTSINRWERSMVQTPAHWQDECGGAEKTTDAVPNAVPFVLFCFDGNKKRKTQFFSVGKSYR